MAKRPFLCPEGVGFCTNNLIGQDFGDVFVMLDEGYNFDGIQNPGVARLGDTAFDPLTTVFSTPNFYGAHGHDPRLASMSATFIAAGPHIGRGTRPPRLQHRRGADDHAHPRRQAGEDGGRPGLVGDLGLAARRPGPAQEPGGATFPSTFVASFSFDQLLRREEVELLLRRRHRARPHQRVDAEVRRGGPARRRSPSAPAPCRRRASRRRWSAQRPGARRSMTSRRRSASRRRRRRAGRRRRNSRRRRMRVSSFASRMMCAIAVASGTEPPGEWSTISVTPFARSLARNSAKRVGGARRDRAFGEGGAMRAEAKVHRRRLALLARPRDAGARSSRRAPSAASSADRGGSGCRAPAAPS